MNSFLRQNALLMVHSLSVRLVPFHTAHDGSELARRVVVALLMGAVAMFAALLSRAAKAEERIYLTRTEIESSLAGKSIVSKNIATGKLSHWDFRSDGTVEAAGSLGRASGTWTIRDDGQTCVRIARRTGCRYWFRKDGAYANADTNQPGSPVVAEVRYD